MRWAERARILCTTAASGEDKVLHVARRATFYTCLYRTMLFPRMLHEYDAATGTPVHRSPYNGKIEPGVLYADNGFWDTHRCAAGLGISTVPLPPT